MTSDLDGFLDDAATRAPGHEVTLTIRDLISRWGARRRGIWYVKEIQDDLDRHGLVTSPSFVTGWIDNEIRLIRKPTDAPVTPREAGSVVSDDQVTRAAETGVALRVGGLESASAGVVAVKREDSLSRAQSLMLQWDYSQLPVLAGSRELLGAISWESVAKTRMHRRTATVGDCTVAADLVALDDDLLTYIPRIIDNGYVFVRAIDKTICGIVTSADLSTTFLSLAGPFLLVGEVERQLRRIVDQAFKLEEIRAVRDPADSSREITGADDLTMGEYVRIFESRERWEALGWEIDRQVFVESLSTLRELRNEIMHFSPDPLEEEKLTAVRHLLKWLKLFAT